MDSFYRTSRRGTLVTIAICSMLGGLVLIWHLLRPGVINLIPTTQLLILLGLFVLPAITVGAWALDLKHIKAAAPPRDAPRSDAARAEALSESLNLAHGHAPGRDPTNPGRHAEAHRHRRTTETPAPAR